MVPDVGLPGQQTSLGISGIDPGGEEPSLSAFVGVYTIAGYYPDIYRPGIYPLRAITVTESIDVPDRDLSTLGPTSHSRCLQTFWGVSERIDLHYRDWFWDTLTTAYEQNLAFRHK